ncbi:hypothetical protein R3X28_00015 [Maribacter sp. TH_r10]|uniref:hypothetical protein n=1 Tax=Maribacter sp. TH_r10 TaxID=3082086 RepID=UPI00295367CB|nr:hypothetical protein [Maribacter sp. TH_r10]MDV7137234.1 hypothetical protein [Maribacter sp. TH_r10]
MKSYLLLLLLVSQISVSCTKSDRTPIVLNPKIEKGLLEYWKEYSDDKNHRDLPLCLSLDKYDGINRVAINLSEIYSDDEMKGLFYLDSIPVILLLADEKNYIFDKKLVEKIYEKADFYKLEKNLKEYSESHDENVSDSFDPPYFLYELSAAGLKRVR